MKQTNKITKQNLKDAIHLVYGHNGKLKGLRNG